MTGRPQRSAAEVELLQALGRNIEVARVNAGVRSAAEIARNVGVSEASMSAYIRGKQRPSPDILRKISDFLGVSLGDLMPSIPGAPHPAPRSPTLISEHHHRSDLFSEVDPIRLPKSYESRSGEVDPVALAELQAAINRLLLWRRKQMGAERLVRFAVRLHDEILDEIERE